MNSYNVELIADVSKRGENIQLLVDEGMSFNAAYKEVSGFYKTQGLSAGRTGGFRKAYYSWLKEEVRTESDMLLFIQENGTENDRKNPSHYLAILTLVESVRS